MLFCNNVKCPRTSAVTAYTSSKVDHMPVVNRAAVLGMRSIGQGYTSALRFSGFMDLPPPLNKNSWAEHTMELSHIATNVMEIQLRDASIRLKKQQAASGKVPGLTGDETDETLSETVVDISVSVDASWSSRGMSAPHGVVGVVSSDTCEVQDITVLTRSCPECSKWEGQKDSDEYLEFYADHFPDCPVNHTGSSASMEADGVVQLFKRSEDKSGLRYTTYIGDGDSKGHKKVTEAKPYGEDVAIKKLECIGHMQKRMGTNLCKLLSQYKDKDLSDGKKLSGRNRLTIERVDYLQVLYGKAIRDNAHKTAEEMSQAVMAILGHYSEPADHSLCPPGPDSFCSYQTLQPSTVGWVCK